MEVRELQHFFHEHPLILIAEEHITNGGNDHPEAEIKCNGCRIPISGPFYSCGECPYFLHKVCAELPSELDHPFHPEHPLTLLEHSPYETGYYDCNLCKEEGHCVDRSRFTYFCLICKFKVDMKCASATHVTQEKCHPHPLTPLQIPNAFALKCHICLKEEEGCLFFAHVGCARSETIMPSPSTSRDQNTDGQSIIFLPMKQDSTDLISRFVRNYIDEDANIDNKIYHFDHEHPLFLIDEETSDDKTCEACAIRISAPSYGCVECDYFLHKCCTDLPKKIQDHPLHPQHQLALRGTQGFNYCQCCKQWFNLFFYECPECEFFGMDIKCASVVEGDVVVYHEAHKHPLFPRVKSSSRCTACGLGSIYIHPDYTLQCNTCRFELCYRCAMAPAVIKHRYGGKSEEPFRLTYSPPKNHHDDEEYLCEICLDGLIPKYWYYHCVFADQFAHIWCMVDCGADSNIKYGKSHMFNIHEQHEVTTISCTYDCSPCSLCRHPMRIGLRGGGVGLECKTCNFRMHPICPSDEDS